MGRINLNLLDAIFIQAMHSHQEWLELATDEYSDWWQFECNQDLGMYKEAAD
jgi:hypothetical protein